MDYTRARLPEGASSVVIQTYMAHHQAMMILGIANVIHDGAMRQRFHGEPMIKAAELLLQERMPRNVAVARLPPEMQTGAITFFDKTPRVPRSFPTPHTSMPRTHLLSNGNYSVMVTAAGGGYSRWRGLAITRWREDVTRDNWGSFIYLRDLRGGKVWSAGYQPTGQEAESYEAVFSQDRATIKRTDGTISTLLEILVSPEADSEVRRISITNTGSRLREIEVTSYAELALASSASRTMTTHPAFSKLFVETEYLRDTGALLATRRPRIPSEPPVWAAHLSVTEGGTTGDVQYETDRGKFLTRGKNARSAAAVSEGQGRCPTRTRRRRTGPGLQPKTYRADSARPDGHDRFLDHGGGVFPAARRSSIWWTVATMTLRPLRTRHHPGRYPCPNPVAISGHRRRRGPSLPASGQLPDLLRCRAAGAARNSGARRAAGLGAVGRRHFRRPADRAGADQRRNRHPVRAADVAGAGILAGQKPGGGFGDPQ